MQYIVIKTCFGYTVKEFTGEAPADQEFKIFNTKEAADEYVELKMEEDY